MPQPRLDDRNVITLEAGRVRARSDVPDDGERGRILLFTGVRYERIADPTAFALPLDPAVAEERARS